MTDAKTRTALLEAVDAGFEAQVALTEELTRFPSLRGQEAPAQDFMARQMQDRGLDVDSLGVGKTWWSTW